MGAPNPESINNPIQRYQNLKLKESLSIPYHFPSACPELGFILKTSYSKFPKNLQTLIFQDTLFAFSLLTEVQTRSAIAAANSLLQIAVSVLPKQKRAVASKEYKRAAVAGKRKSKGYQEEAVLSLLPLDILIHVFGFLDLQALVSASAVCWSWNAAAGDNNLWKYLYGAYFCGSDNALIPDGIESVGVPKNEDVIPSLEGVGLSSDTDWKYTFRKTFKERRSKKFKANRGYCSSCSSIVWLSTNKPYKKDGCNHQIKPIASHQIVDYILDGSLPSESSSDSDSDAEDVSVFWDYRMRISRNLSI